ncbi:MAG TPA: DUF3619 family protein [Gammaproteobacteria bacterium]|nr:DUF3619 family protein [Gammaproteobacteria bacterium]
MNTKDDEFLKQTRKALDESADSLDAATCSRLNQARQKALQNHARQRLFAFGLPAGIMAGIGVAALTTWLLTSLLNEDPSLQMQLVQSGTWEVEDIDMLTSDTELELLEELEFVSWLVLEQNNAG